jgi:iron-sulfur cluster repair protein YtfE (RIC family)
MMQLVAQLHDDHRALDTHLARLEELLNRRRNVPAALVESLLDQIVERLSRHIRFEETHFYAPLKASGQAREDLMAILAAEHEDLLKTLEHLQQLRSRGWSVDDEEFMTYSTHLIELYREHTEREHRWLFPLLEQPPQVSARQPAAVSKDTTLNAMIRRFPELLDVLHAFRLDCRWFGSDTLEEVAWYHGVQVEHLLGELNRSLTERR